MWTTVCHVRLRFFEIFFQKKICFFVFFCFLLVVLGLLLISSLTEERGLLEGPYPS